MPPKKKTKQSTDDPQESNVFVLMRTEYNHAAHIEPKLMGVYASKDVAARVAGSLDTDCLGTFDEAIDEYENQYDSEVIDNRQSPPDDGILIQCGHEDEGEGDRIILEIQKFPLVTKTNLQIKERKPKHSDESDEDEDGGRVLWL